MERAIVGFRQDGLGDWIADLACGHYQHVRHKPPLIERPWVMTAEGREGFVGSPLGCVRCDRLEMPAGFAPYKRTRTFDQDSLPAALRAHHSTRAGVWGLIHVEEGALIYRVAAPLERVQRLTPGAPGVVAAEVEHSVEPEGAVRCFVEFWRAGGAQAG